MERQGFGVGDGHPAPISWQVSQLVTMWITLAPTLSGCFGGLHKVTNVNHLAKCLI